ncbi:hypothetical protein CAEBREN_00776 [Caenorhabditis brenneri]|uniref:G-protein coupled receptors family 1 profile domain-containing protein n=1 Tax=Caenorhabditis brenneri TaxID=135651 RepID=G0N754_CAEBE|nr:hypothetical protein CAEBREN_00776 [Caenorhabditis brenneri]
MYYFLTTTTPGSTTERWFGFEKGDFYYYDGGPEPYWQSKENYVFGEDTKEKFVENSNIIDNYLALFGLFLNIAHLVVLTQKELRVNVVFIIIIGICICDMLVCTGSVAERYFTRKTWSTGYFDYCGTNQQLLAIVIVEVSQAIQKFGRLTSAVFALSTALIRTTTVLFPISSISDTLMRTRTGMIIVFTETTLCGSSYLLYYAQARVEREGQVPFTVCYFIGEPTEYRNLVKNIEGYTILLLTVLYIIATIILLISLGLAQKRRKNLKSEKSNNTSMLVIFMAISFLISQIAYSLILLLDSWSSQTLDFSVHSR